jgi:hypothetical protein
MQFRRHGAPLASVLAALSVCLVAAGSANAVTPHVVYGKPGPVQLVPTEGSRTTGQDPVITFPKHTIRRSTLAAVRKDPQKICTQFQIMIQATPPATGWVLQTSSPLFCGWIAPGRWAGVSGWGWQGAINVPYHVQYLVTWATKKRKKLARATYDFDTPADYHCTTRFCAVQATPDNSPFIRFFG